MNGKSIDIDDFMPETGERDYDAVHGQRPEAPFRSPASVTEIAVPPEPRRPETLMADGDADCWWNDVATWMMWLTDTFRLGRYFPPCWMRHPQLVEEAQALFLLWGDSWFGETGARAPVMFLRELDASLARIENRWQVPCTPREHTEQPDQPLPQYHTPSDGPAWWSNTAFRGVE